MNTIKNLRDLLVEEGRELYDANQQELKALKNIEAQAWSPSLKDLIKKQRQHAESQQKQLKEAFDHLQVSYTGGKDETTKSIFKRTQLLIDQSKTKETRDAGIISSLQQLNHRKIAGLGNSASHAQELGQKLAARILHDALEQEKKMDKELSILAQFDINKKSAEGMLV